jgi:hypothetical protein
MGGLLKGDEMTLAGLELVDDRRSSSPGQLASAMLSQPWTYGMNALTSVQLPARHHRQLLPQMRNLGLQRGIALQHAVDLLALGAQLGDLVLQALDVLLGARADGALRLAVVGALALQLLGRQRRDLAHACSRVAFLRAAGGRAGRRAGGGSSLGHGEHTDRSGQRMREKV